MNEADVRRERIPLLRSTVRDRAFAIDISLPCLVMFTKSLRTEKVTSFIKTAMAAY